MNILVFHVFPTSCDVNSHTNWIQLIGLCTLKQRSHWKVPDANYLVTTFPPEMWLHFCLFTNGIRIYSKSVACWLHLKEVGNPVGFENGTKHESQKTCQRKLFEVLQTICQRSVNAKISTLQKCLRVFGGLSTIMPRNLRHQVLPETPRPHAVAASCATGLWPQYSRLPKSPMAWRRKTSDFTKIWNVCWCFTCLKIYIYIYIYG